MISIMVSVKNFILYWHPYKDNSQFKASVERMPKEEQIKFLLKLSCLTVSYALIVASMFGLPLIFFSMDEVIVYVPYGMLGVMVGTLLWIFISAIPLYLVAKRAERMMSSIQDS